MRVTFKHEDQASNGEPRGPVSILTDKPEEAPVRTYRDVCVCDGPHTVEVHPNGGPCLSCGDFWRPWYRLTQAKEIAAYHGVELEIV